MGCLSRAFIPLFRIAYPSPLTPLSPYCGPGGGTTGTTPYMSHAKDVVPKINAQSARSHYSSSFTAWYIFNGIDSIFVKPFTSSAVHALLISPYSANLAFIRSCFDSMPTSEKV